MIHEPALAAARSSYRAGEQLRAQLLLLAGGCGRVRVHAERAWGSITFSGSRHKLQLRFEGDEVAGGEAMVAAAPDHEFAIPGYLVADVAVVDVEHRVLDELLTVTVEAVLLEEG